MQQMVQEAVRCDKLVCSGNNTENMVLLQKFLSFICYGQNIVPLKFTASR